ncbi:MAG: hypothetical protein GTN80_07755 [Nitrososphaeria archaeon]|nr:hypothetical protein [Nitrososphaeria archaeon]NIQ33518.1 hypothetical protein [Nitrososphaeria archaeon]
MKLVTFEAEGVERTGILLDDRIVDANAAYASYLKDEEDEDLAVEIAGVKVPPDMIRLLSTGRSGRRALENAKIYVEKLLGEDQEDLVSPGGLQVIYNPGEIRWKAPIPRPSKLVELAFAYKGVADEFDLKRDSGDVIFMEKALSAITAHEMPIIHPKDSERVITEIELGIIMGKRAEKVGEEEALEYVAGYTIVNDINAIDISLQDSFLMHYKGDSYPTFAPIGPCLVLKDQVPDPNDLDVTIWINGVVGQSYNTGEALHTVSQIVSQISGVIPLETGDIISCGAYSGVSACVIKPKDIIECEIKSIGRLRNHVVAEE